MGRKRSWRGLNGCTALAMVGAISLLNACSNAPLSETISSDAYPMTCTITFKAKKDTTINQFEPSLNDGSSNTCKAQGGARDLACLIKWGGELVNYDPAATVTAAFLRLYVSNLIPGATTTQSYPIYRVKKSWTESEATWITAHTSTTTLNWELPGAQGPTDRGPQVGTFQGSGQPGWHSVTLNADGIAMVQSWLTHYNSRGIIVADPTNTDNVIFNSSEYGEREPRVEIHYQTTNDCYDGLGGAAGSGGD